MIGILAGGLLLGAGIIVTSIIGGALGRNAVEQRQNVSIPPSNNPVQNVVAPIGDGVVDGLGGLLALITQLIGILPDLVNVLLILLIFQILSFVLPILNNVLNPPKRSSR